MDDHLNFTQPIEAQFAHDGLETAIASAVKQVFAENLANQMQDLVDYGSPHIGSATVVERFTKQDGLAVLRRSSISDTFMRKMYASWLSIASERGLSFLGFTLQMIWGDGNWELRRLWHSIPRVTQYPLYVDFEERPNYFLTSRILVSLGEVVTIPEVLEFSPTLRRLVPAHILPIIHAKILDRNWSYDLGVTIGEKRYQVVDLSEGVIVP